MSVLDARKQGQRAMWAMGDYNKIAETSLPIADHVVRTAEIRAGEHVLDVACGTGNTALVARARGATVTGIDLTPELLDIAVRRAAEAGYDDVTWREGDAESLPFEDATFDVVVSSCGLMFAPDQRKAASEVARVTRPGGRIAIQAWSPKGGVGRFFKVIGSHAPPPAGAPNPLDWGVEENARSLLGPAFEDYRFEHDDCPQYADTPEEMADTFIRDFGPTYFAYHSLDPGQAAAFRDDLIEVFRGYVTPADGKVRFGREYLIALARRR